MKITVRVVKEKWIRKGPVVERVDREWEVVTVVNNHNYPNAKSICGRLVGDGHEAIVRGGEVLVRAE